MTYQLLADAGAQGDNMSWPDTLVLIAMFALMGFVAWVLYGRR